MISMCLARDVLYGSRENVNFVHEVYRQAFLLNFTHSSAIRKAISIYKDWIEMSAPDIPSFILEPADTGRARLSSSEHSSMEASFKAFETVFKNIWLMFDMCRWTEDESQEWIHIPV